MHGTNMKITVLCLSPFIGTKFCWE